MRIRILITTLIVVLLAGFAAAQPDPMQDLFTEQWSAYYGSADYEKLRDVKMMPDGGLAISGNSGSPSQGYLVRTDTDGNPLWEALVGGGGQDQLAEIFVNSDGNILAVGRDNSAQDGIAYLFDDATGEVIWSYTHVDGGYNDFSDALDRPGGGYYLAGSVGTPGHHIVVEVDENGNFLTERHINNNYFHDLEHAPDGGYVMIGWNGGTEKVYKYDASWNLEWSITLQQASDVGRITPMDDGFLVTAFGNGDYYVGKLDFDGTIIWELNHGGPGEQKARSSIVLSDGTILIGGSNDYWYADKDIYLLALDADGNELYTAIYQNPGDDHYPQLVGNDDVLAFAARNDPGMYGENDFFAVYFETGSETLPFSLTPLSDPMLVPASGGSIYYSLDLENPSDCWFEDLMYWVDITGPDGNVIEQYRTAVFSLWPGRHLVIDTIENAVPGWAPEGDYLFEGHIGYYPDIMISDSFTFTKLGVAPPGEGEYWQHNDLLLDGGTSETPDSRPSEFTLGAAYPNPFNASTSMHVTLPHAVKLQVTVVDLLGREVANLAQGQHTAGTHRLSFNAGDLASGVYFVCARAGEWEMNQRILLLK